MFSKPKIFVGTDFSAAADEALRMAEIIRQRTGGTLELVHVSPLPDDWDWITMDVVVNYGRSDFKRDLIHSLEKKMKNQLRRCEVDAATRLSFGPELEGLKELVTKEKPDLLVLGHHGKRNFLQHLGSVTQKFIAEATVPVMVVKKTSTSGKVAALLDTDQVSEKAIAAAEELSFLMNSKPTFVTVWQDLIPMRSHYIPEFMPEYALSPDERARVMTRIRKTIHAKADPRFESEIIVENTMESVPEALKTILNREQVSLAVMPRHHKGLLEKIFIGSVTRRMLDIFEGNLLILPE